MPEITLRNLYFSYPPLQTNDQPVPVLTGVDLEIERGEFLSVIGPTGAGKTTLCLALNGIVPHSSGGRFGGDAIVTGLNTREHPVALLASRVGIVFQDAESQLFNMTVESEVAFGPESLGLPRAEIGRRVDWALAAVGMAQHRERSPFHLSGGQKQRVAIAAALAMLPRVLVLDEPTAGLDPIGKEEVFDVIRDLQRRRQMTIVLVEQEAEKIAEFSDRVAVLHEGRIELIGSPKEIFSQVDRLHEIGVAAPQVSELAALINARQGTNYAFTTLDEAREALAPSLQIAPLKAGPQKQKLEQSQPCIQVCDLWHRYNGNTEALRGLNLEISSGDFVALIGQNGSGKTTLVKHFNGLLKPTRGRVRVYGQDTSKLSVGKLARRVGYVFQNPDRQIFSPTVREELAFGPRNLGLSAEEVEERVLETLARFRLEAHAQAPPALLGYGLRRKVGVAAVYAMHPQIFILDEPSTGLDRRGIQELMSLLKAMNAEGHTILLITHDMRIVAEHARRTVVLHEGRVLADGDTASVLGRSDELARAGIRPPQIAQLAQSLWPRGETLAPTVEAFCDAYVAFRAEGRVGDSPYTMGWGMQHEL